MYRRSFFGIALLSLATSCVPPAARGPSRLADASVSVALPAVEPAAILQTGTVGPFIPLVPLSAVPGHDVAEAAASAPPAWEPGEAVAARPFVQTARSEVDADRALDCLTAAIYYEARSEPMDGQRAVAQVVLNRVRSGVFPASICGVVYQGADRPTGCQFTFACDGSMLLRRDPAAWLRARRVAEDALDGGVYAPVGLATYYHTTAVHPWWAPSLQPVTTIGAHIFYRWPGLPGGPAAFGRHYAGVEPEAGGAMMSDDAGEVSESAGVAVHRGEGGASFAATESASQAGVRIHFGLEKADSGVAAVAVHSGTAPETPGA